MHSPNPSLSPQASIETTSDTNNNNLERLKQQSQHCNGTPSTNNIVSTSTQTNHSPLHTQNFTNSQKEVLRLIGQHLQSAGLRYKEKKEAYGLFCIIFILVKHSKVLSQKVVVFSNMNKHRIFVN
jgi:hypothetical protein